MNQPDFFDGIFDNTTTMRREIYKDGALMRYAAKNCCNDPASPWRELRAPWGTYPPRQDNGR